VYYITYHIPQILDTTLSHTSSTQLLWSFISPYSIFHSTVARAQPTQAGCLERSSLSVWMLKWVWTNNLNTSHMRPPVGQDSSTLCIHGNDKPLPIDKT
jgi:hypothetical protein